MSDALVLEYISNRPNQGGLPHLQHHHHTTTTFPTPANMSSPSSSSSTTTPFTLHEPTPTHPQLQKLPFGRGGAGNRTTLPPSSLTTTKTSTHSLHASNPATHGMPNYSTGRGGVGNMHGADEERRIFSFDEELAKQGKVGAVPVYHIGRGGQGNAIVEARRGSGESGGSKGSGSEGVGGRGRGSLEWFRGLGKRG